MPYITKTDRNIFNVHLNQIISLILNEKSRFQKSECLGDWVRYMVSVALGGSGVEICSNAEIESETNKFLNYLFEPLSEPPTEEQIFSLAGNLNYCISYVTWAILGDHKDAQKASYGMRCYTAQQIRNSLSLLSLNKSTRLNTILQGVLNDVLDELYRRKTATYEDKKILENGDLEY